MGDCALRRWIYFAVIVAFLVGWSLIGWVALAFFQQHKR